MRTSRIATCGLLVACALLLSCPNPVLTPVSAPFFSPSSGTFNSDQLITINCVTSGALIYYTTDGSDPTTSSTAYSGPIAVGGNGTVMTIEAMATASGMTDSAVSSATYTIDYWRVSPPQLSPTAGTYTSDRLITISCVTPEASIYYTTDGSDPTTSSTAYSGPIAVGGNGTVMTIKAMATASGMTASEVGSAAYTIQYPRVAVPKFSPAGGWYVGAQEVAITSATSGASIRYTTDGSVPTQTAGVLYRLPIKVTPNLTVKAIAYETGWSDSDVATAVYTIPVPSWTARTLPSRQNWYSVTYGNGTFVAVAWNSSAAATSPDGITWTARTLPGPFTGWNSVTYGNGVFVAVDGGPSDVAATSPDGITWTARTLPGPFTGWNSVTYGNGVFVAVDGGPSDVAATSPDGINWTARTLPSSQSWNSVTYGNGVFVVVAGGPSNVAATSPDGITWTARTLPVNDFWRSVTYGNGALVAVSEGTVSATSPDGITWTERTLPSSRQWSSVTYGNGVFVTVGYDSSVAATSP